MVNDKVRILVTGGTGFIGRRTVERMSKILDLEIFVIARKYHKDEHNVHYIQGDIVDSNSVRSIMREIRPQRLLHLAWDVNSKGYANSVINMDWKVWSICLLHSFLANGGMYVVSSGTCFEYNLAGTDILTETDICEPSNVYGRCKLETYRDFSKLCYQYGARHVWGRIFYPYGVDEEERKLFHDVIVHLMSGKRFLCRAPDNIIDYIYVDDVANMLTFLVTSNVAYGIYNLCSGCGVQIEKVLRYIAKRLKREDLLEFQYGHKGDYIVGSNQRIAELGFDRTQLLSIEQGIEKYLSAVSFVDVN